jgi:uncharacterized damage-inducible protein DinB
MIAPAHTQAMARYNAWQNQSIYSAANTLSDAERGQDRGAFWQSIDLTLRHILWADQMWMSRFSNADAPKALNQPLSSHDVATWDGLTRARVEFDETIEIWTAGLTDTWLQGDLTWRSGITGEDATKPRWYVVTHLFNHQTHHRGQVHCMLTQAGAEPEDTDLPFMPD